MKLLNTKEVELYCDNAFYGSKNKAAFLTGVIHAEQQLLPLMVEFGELCRMEAHIGAKTTEQY